MSRQPDKKPCGTCVGRSALSYMQWHYDADRRHKSGQRQVQCPECGLWQWPDSLLEPASRRPRARRRKP